MPRRPFIRIIGIALLFALPIGLIVGLATWLWREHQRETQFKAAIAQAAARYRLDPALIKAVIWRESRFDPNAKGAAGEIGLMQVREWPAEEWAEAEKLKDFRHTDIFEPTRNIHAGSWYLAKLLKRYTNCDNPIPYALADYNAGRTHVLRWNKGRASTNSAAFLEGIDYPGTRRYAIAVMERYEHYRVSGKKP
jgi:soluble lytic murein transglycosylase